MSKKMKCAKLKLPTIVWYRKKNDLEVILNYAYKILPGNNPTSDYLKISHNRKIKLVN